MPATGPLRSQNRAGAPRHMVTDPVDGLEAVVDGASEGDRGVVGELLTSDPTQLVAAAVGVAGHVSLRSWSGPR